jgi:F0F1-type ATP synthase assembly protein I
MSQDNSNNEENSNNTETKVPKHRDKLVALDSLSLGISIVVAILIGVALGVGMRSFFGYDWLLWLGVFWGIGGAITNVYKVYSRQKKDLDELANDPKYKHFNDTSGDDDY